MKRKVGIVEDALRTIDDPIERIRLVKEAGFESYSTNSYTKEQLSVIANEAARAGLIPDFIHASFKDINSIWYKTEEHPEIFFKMCEAIDTAAEFSIPNVVVHTASGWNHPEITEKGIHRYDLLVERAAKLGVRIAFENLRTVPYTAYFLHRYRNIDAVGACYDSGHEFCRTETVDWLGIFRDRVTCTHIHDNFGRRDIEGVNDDCHLLPFDGKIDFADMVARLDKHGYEGILTLEVFNNLADYGKLCPEEFLKRSYDAISKINAYSV